MNPGSFLGSDISLKFSQDYLFAGCIIMGGPVYNNKTYFAKELPVMFPGTYFSKSIKTDYIKECHITLKTSLNNRKGVNV